MVRQEVAALVAKAELEPAQWLGEKRAGRAVPLKKHDIVAARELVDYTKLAEDARSRSIVASFLFDDVSPSDEEPGDFVVEALSIRDALRAYGDPDKRPKENLPACKELARLYRRGIWIARRVARGEADADDLERTMGDASPDAHYMKERARLGTHPHFAAYWLLSHAFQGRGELLEDALVRTRTVKNRVIADLRKKLT